MPPDVTHLLTHSAVVARFVRGVATGGGRPERLARVATGVPCRAAGMAMATLAPAEGGLSSDSSRSVYFAPGADVRQADICYLFGANGTPMGPHRVEAIDPQGDGVYLKTRQRGAQPSFPNVPADPPA